MVPTDFPQVGELWFPVYSPDDDMLLVIDTCKMSFRPELENNWIEVLTGKGIKVYYTGVIHYWRKVA